MELSLDELDAVVAGKYHPTNNCPRCGATQYTISGFRPDGSHNHTCPRCGTSWHHRTGG